ncbi:MAG: hypothetical protein AB7F78_00050 [Hyphomicrobiaceae bacterium]
MSTNELLAVMDREQNLLTEDNWHAAAAVIGEAAEKLRRHREVMRAVETWWLKEGMQSFDGAPACIFSLRETLDT